MRAPFRCCVFFLSRQAEGGAGSAEGPQGVVQFRKVCSKRTEKLYDNFEQLYNQATMMHMIRGKTRKTGKHEKHTSKHVTLQLLL